MKKLVNFHRHLPNRTELIRLLIRPSWPVIIVFPCRDYVKFLILKFVIDGASAVLLMSEEKALQLGYKPLSFIKRYLYDEYHD